MAEVDRMVDLKERNFIEITKSDLQRMRGSPPKDHHIEFLKEKLNLKALSDERAQRWPNTIKGLHEKRLQAKKEEQEKLECERLEVDAIEAKLKAERRKEMIERANNLLLLPHMTGLLSKRQRINTTKEREAQIQYKRRIQEIWERQEEKWVQLQKEQLEKWDKQEELKVKRQKELVKALADARLSQLKECEEILMERKRKKEEEKEHLKWLEEQDRILEEEKENLKQERKKERTQEMIKANDAQKVKKEEERQRLIKLDKEIEAFAMKKEKMMDERKKLEAMKLALKAKQRDAISEKLSKELLATKVDNDRKLVLEQSEKKDEEEEKEMMRFQRNKESWEECDKSRKMQVMCKHEQEMRDAANDKYEAERSWERAWQCKSEFQACEKARFLRNKSFAEHHKSMMDYNNMKMKQATQCEIDEERQALQRMEDVEINGITLEDIKL